MNRKLTIGTPTIENLKAFQSQFPGGPVFDLVGRIVQAPQVYTNTDSILGEFRTTLKGCKRYSSDEKTSLCTALETIMDILRMDGSEGMLENYLHGILL